MQQLDAMEIAGPPVDLVENFALPIPSLVICELLGVPYDDREDFQRRSVRQLDFSVPMQERIEMQRQGRAYMATLVSRARLQPGEDILGMLVREHGDELTDDELIGVAGLLLLAGHETTSNMLGLGVLALLRHPDQLAVVRDDPDAVGPAVEELLRWLSIVQTAIPRIATTDVEVAGVTIPAGTLVFPSMPSGNRDRGVHRLARGARYPSRGAGASGVRARRASLPRCAAGPHGDAHRVPCTAATAPEPGAGRGFRGREVPNLELHLRSEVVGGELVKVQADRDVCIQAGNCVMSPTRSSIRTTTASWWYSSTRFPMTNWSTREKRSSSARHRR